MAKIHPRQALFDPGDAAPALPVCDHYAGTESRMRKSLALQAELGPVFAQMATDLVSRAERALSEAIRQQVAAAIERKLGVPPSSPQED